MVVDREKIAKRCSNTDQVEVAKPDITFGPVPTWTLAALWAQSSERHRSTCQELGYAAVETTLNSYTHAIPDTHRRAIESLEEALFQTVPQVRDSGKTVIH
jgi:hypothetical protein